MNNKIVNLPSFPKAIEWTMNELLLVLPKEQVSHERLQAISAPKTDHKAKPPLSQAVAKTLESGLHWRQVRAPAVELASDVENKWEHRLSGEWLWYTWKSVCWQNEAMGDNHSRSMSLSVVNTTDDSFCIAKSERNQLVLVIDGTTNGIVNFWHKVYSRMELRSVARRLWCRRLWRVEGHECRSTAAEHQTETADHRWILYVHYIDVIGGRKRLRCQFPNKCLVNTPVPINSTNFLFR